jgi:hypothetical protein
MFHTSVNQAVDYCDGLAFVTRRWDLGWQSVNSAAQRKQSHRVFTEAHFSL